MTEDGPHQRRQDVGQDENPDRTPGQRQPDHGRHIHHLRGQFKQSYGKKGEVTVQYQPARGLQPAAQCHQSGHRQ